jgi:hypothetical protein
MRLANHLPPGEPDLVDHEQTEVPHDEVRELAFVDVGTRHVQSEALGGEAAAVDERDLDIELGSPVVHSTNLEIRAEIARPAPEPCGAPPVDPGSGSGTDRHVREAGLDRMHRMTTGARVDVPVRARAFDDEAAVALVARAGQDGSHVDVWHTPLLAATDPGLTDRATGRRSG